MSEHARLSPSGSKKWFACPGSLTLEASIPDKPNEYSDAGTVCHTVAAWCLVENREAAARLDEYFIASHGTEALRKVKFTQDMVDMTQQYVDDIRRLSEGHELWVEQRVDFSTWVGVDGQFGTADAAILRPFDGGVKGVDFELQIHDAKFGRTPVKVENNSQLMLYALGFLSKLKAKTWFDVENGTVGPLASITLSGGRCIQSLRLFIHQPALHPGPIEWECSVEELGIFAKIANEKSKLVLKAETEYPLTPAPEWNRKFLNPNPNKDECAWCRATPTCPAMRAKLETALHASFDKIWEDPAHLAPPALLPGTHLEREMMIADLLEDRIRAVRGEVERRLLAGEEMLLFGLELGRKGARQFVDEEEVETLLKKSFRLNNEEMYNFKLKTPTQLERLLKPVKLEDGTVVPAAIGATQWKKVTTMVTQNPPKPSVKLKSTIKKPYKPEPPSVAGFENIDEEPLY